MQQIENAHGEDSRIYARFPIEDNNDIVSHFRLQLGDSDIYDNYQPILDLLHSLLAEMKVPKKAKAYE